MSTSESTITISNTVMRLFESERKIMLFFLLLFGEVNTNVISSINHFILTNIPEMQRIFWPVSTMSVLFQLFLNNTIWHNPNCFAKNCFRSKVTMTVFLHQSCISLEQHIYGANHSPNNCTGKVEYHANFLNGRFPAEVAILKQVQSPEYMYLCVF